MDTKEIIDARFASVAWCVGDLTELAEERDIELSDEDADRLLAENSNMIQGAMVEAGWVALGCILDDLRTEKKDLNNLPEQSDKL